jgi:hypothetical protein
MIDINHSTKAQMLKLNTYNTTSNQYRVIENKKIEMAAINAFQLAARKNLIQMSSDVITILTVIFNY